MHDEDLALAPRMLAEVSKLADIRCPGTGSDDVPKSSIDKAICLRRADTLIRTLFDATGGPA